MKESVERIFIFKPIVFLAFTCLMGCGITQTKYQREYAKVWKELIKRQAWKESYVGNKSNSTEEAYATNENEFILAESAKKELGFEDKYQTLVSKAYFKIITEAEKADARISAEYQTLQDDTGPNKLNKKKLTEITKRYKAHRAMLSGLKSWNIFSENRSGDMDYFKAENREEVQRMIRAGETDDQMVSYLIYKLADLYHVEEN